MGCGGNNADTSWVDIKRDGFPGIDDDEFVPTFVKENKKSLNNLAEMMLVYDFRFLIDRYDGDVRVVIRNDNSSNDEKERLADALLGDEELMSKSSDLLELEYISSIQRFTTNAGYRGLSVEFITQSTPLGSFARNARYCSDEEMDVNPARYGSRGEHITGNWFYCIEGLV